MPTPTIAEVLWGSQQRPKRGPKPSLSIELLVETAIAMADTDGLANLSMQRLAERLGFTKMALYRYIPGRAELTALMVDYGLAAPPDLAAVAPGTEALWRTQLRTWAVGIFERYSAHPWAIELTNGARVFGPNELGWLEAALTALAGTGLTGPERLDTVVLLNGHVRSLVQHTATETQGTVEEQLGAQLSEILIANGERYPESAAAFAESATTSGRDHALHFGIDRILDGVEAFIAKR